MKTTIHNNHTVIESKHGYYFSPAANCISWTENINQAKQFTNTTDAELEMIKINELRKTANYYPKK